MKGVQKYERKFSFTRIETKKYKKNSATFTETCIQIDPEKQQMCEALVKSAS